MHHDVVVVGSVNVDLVLEVARHPHPGETVLGRSATVLPGGKGANQAVAAARLGARVAMVGAVGADEYAATALSELARAGVDLTEVRHVDGPTGLAVITLAEDGENSVVVIAGANTTTDEAAVTAAGPLITAARGCGLQAGNPPEGVAPAAPAAGAPPLGQRAGGGRPARIGARGRLTAAGGGRPGRPRHPVSGAHPWRGRRGGTRRRRRLVTTRPAGDGPGHDRSRRRLRRSARGGTGRRRHRARRRADGHEGRRRLGPAPRRPALLPPEGRRAAMSPPAPRSCGLSRR